MSIDDPAAPPEPWGHQIDVGSFLRDVVQLMAYIGTGSHVSMIWRGKERDPDEQLAKFRRIVEFHLRTEIPRLMISIAATLRAKVDDGSWCLPDSVGYIGWLSQGHEVDPERSTSLSLREVCNKIIHAEKVRTEAIAEREELDAIGPLVSIYGSRGGNPWSAQINLMAFCIAIADCDFDPHGRTGCRS